MAAASSAVVPSQSNNFMSSSTPNVLYKLKITLTDHYHKVRGGRWRRVIVPANFSLLELHVVIQLVFGWENYHLHHFMSMAKNEKPRSRLHDPVEYKIPEEYDDPILMQDMKDERVYKLSDIFSEENPFLEYEYDFGASWEHVIKFEGGAPENIDCEYPTCVDGKGANRREDHQDEDEDGDLLPDYQGKQFSRQDAQRAIQRVFAGKWPLKVDKTTVQKCYLCAFFNSAFGTCRGPACTGNCCNVCLKAEFLRDHSTPVSNGEAESSDDDF